MPFNPQFYLSNGAVDIAVVLALAMAVVDYTKRFLVPFFKGGTANVNYDTAVQAYDLVLSFGGVYFLWWAGPGFHSRQDVVGYVVGTLIGFLGQQGLYSKLHANVPVTPTSEYITKLQAHVAALAPYAASGSTINPSVMVEDLRRDLAATRDWMEATAKRVEAAAVKIESDVAGHVTQRRKPVTTPTGQVPSASPETASKTVPPERPTS